MTDPGASFMGHDPANPRTQRAIRKFLGENATGRGPFGLLGLTPNSCTPARVEAALERQLDRVSGHPSGRTPEADDVRLALHTAAAQLLDADVRRELSRRYTGPMSLPADTGAPIPDAIPDSPRPAARALSPARRSLPPDEQLITIEDDPNRALRAGLWAAGAVVCVVIIVVGIAVATIGTRPSRPVAATQPAISPPAAPASSPAQSPDSGSASARPALPDEIGAVAPASPDGRSLVRDLRAAVALGPDSPRRSAEVTKSIDAIAAWWPRLSIGERRAVINDLLELFYTASAPEAGQIAVRLRDLAAPLDSSSKSIAPPQIWPAAWALGVLARLDAEPNLSRAASAPVTDAIIAVVGVDELGALHGATARAAFEIGAEAALVRIPLIVATSSAAPSRESIDRWLEAARAITQNDDAALERLVLAALTRVLTLGPEPNTVQSGDTIGALASSITWRRGTDSRERLLGWFRDQRVSDTDIRLLTSAVANRSGAEGIDARMVLPLGAGADDRARLRAEYAKAWGFQSADEKRAIQERIAAEARTALAAPAAHKSPIQSLTHAAELARLSEASRLAWLGDPAGAKAVLDATQSVIADAIRPAAPTAAPPPAPLGPAPIVPARGPRTSTQSAPGGPIGSGDGAWALAYFKAERNNQLRVDRLLQAESIARPIGPVDAGTLAQVACAGTPSQVRAAAQRAALRFVDDTEMLLALLHELPDAARVSSVSQLLEAAARTNLPAPSDPDWELVTRRSLISRLLLQLSRDGVEALTDRLSGVIAESYARSAGITASASGSNSAELAIRAAAVWAQRIASDAQAAETPPTLPGLGSLTDVERRRAGRRAVASGPVQAFIAEQLAIAEALALTVAVERPARTSEIRSALAELTTSRRNAAHVFDQIDAVERALVRLWLIRLNEEAA